MFKQSDNRFHLVYNLGDCLLMFVGPVFNVAIKFYNLSSNFDEYNSIIIHKNKKKLEVLLYHLTTLVSFVNCKEETISQFKKLVKVWY